LRYKCNNEERYLTELTQGALTKQKTQKQISFSKENDIKIPCPKVLDVNEGKI
jgi:hypothetical protein